MSFGKRLRLWRALKEAGLDQDETIVKMAATLLSINGLENALEFVEQQALKLGEMKQ